MEGSDGGSNRDGDQAGVADGVGSVVSSKIVDKEVLATRRRALVHGVMPLFLERGFHDVTVRDMAHALGWQMGTMYLYFEDKHDVLYMLAQHITHQIWDSVLSLPRVAQADLMFDSVLDRIFHNYAALSREVRFIHRESANLKRQHLELIRNEESKGRDFIASIIRDGSAQQCFRRVDARVMAAVVLAIAHMWPQQSWSLRHDVDREDLIQEEKEMIFRVLRPDS